LSQTEAYSEIRATG